MTVTAMELLKSKGKEIWAVGPGATVFEALELMAEKNIGAVLVMDGASLSGIFSERDYARKVVLAGKTSRDTKVSELMTSDVITSEGSASVRDCMGLFTEHHIRHLPVTNNGKIAGILTIGDVVKHIISNLETTVRDLEGYISGGGYGG